MRRKLLFVCWAFLLVCGCNQSRGMEDTLANPTTVVDEGEVISEEVPTQVTNTDLSEKGIPIDEAHFGDSRFCEVLQPYDLDQDGYFSEEELAQITYLDLNTWRVGETGYTEVKGFEHFISLETLYLESAEWVEIRDLPKLQYLYVGTPDYNGNRNRIVNLQVVDCPGLEEIEVKQITLGEESRNGVFRVENCPKLSYMNMVDVQAYIRDGEITGTPNLRLSVSENVFFSNGLCLDDNIFLVSGFNAWGEAIQDFKEFFCQAEDGKITVLNGFPLRWETSAEPIESIEIMERAKAAAEELRRRFCVRVEEAVPAVTDSTGNKAYHILIDNDYLRRTGFEVRDAENRSVGHYDVLSVVYSDMAPDMTKLSFVWDKTVEESLQVASYSPVQGMRFRENATAQLRMQGKSGEEVLATVEYTMYCDANEKGKLTVRIDDSWEEDEEILGFEKDEEKELVGYMPEEGEIPIDKNTFGGVMFREYLEDYVDVNHNGYLSEEERAAVDDMGLHVLGVGEDGLSGFSWFPNLELLILPKSRRVQCIDCPKLKTIIPYPGSEDDFLEIKNCPALELIDFDSEFWEDEDC